MEIFTAAEVARHNKPNDLWVILDNKVYDITNWHILHPGGSSLLLKYGGRDATQASHDAHGLLKKPVSIMPRYFIGLVGSEEEVRAAEDRKVRKLLEDAKTQKALEAQKELLKAADEEAVSSAPVSPASPASPVAPAPSPSVEPGTPTEPKAKRDSNYAKATYTLLLERMAADRQAVESMISRVKATASKTAAKMTGRGSGAAGPKSEKSEGLGNSDPEDLFSDTERKQALQELESEESKESMPQKTESGLPQKKASDPRVAEKTAALEQAAAEKKAAADKAAAEKKEAASKAAAEKKAAADKAAAEKKAAGDKAAADKTAAEAEKASASQKAAAEKAAAEKAAAEKAAAEKAEKAEKAAAEKAEKAAQQKAAKKAAEKALAEKEAAEKALAEMKAAKEQAEREAAELKAQAEQFQREKEAAEKKANKAAKKAESAKSKLLIVFQSPDGTMAKLMEGLEGKERKTVTFTKRPLGVSCNMDSMPIVVGELPQGEAYTAGVREGWVLCQVGNDPSNMRNFPRSAAEPYASVQETFKFLGQLTKELPQVAS